MLHILIIYEFNYLLTIKKGVLIYIYQYHIK
jgi:hypothetical protein